jgi:hypothetical protein
MVEVVGTYRVQLDNLQENENLEDKGVDGNNIKIDRNAWP